MPFNKEFWISEFKAKSNVEIEGIDTLTGFGIVESFIDAIPESSGEHIEEVVKSMGGGPQMVYNRFKSLDFNPSLSAVLLIVANAATPGIISILVAYIAFCIPKSQRIGELTCDDIRRTLKSFPGSKRSLSEVAYMIPSEESLHDLWRLQKVESSERRDDLSSDNYLDLSSTYDES